VEAGAVESEKDRRENGSEGGGPGKPYLTAEEEGFLSYGISIKNGFSHTKNDVEMYAELVGCF